MRIWLPVAVAVTGLCGLLYATTQQMYREGLNDPQIQIAQDAAATLVADFTPAAVAPRKTQIDIAESLDTWVAVYDTDLKPLESTGVFNNAPPQPPKGVFDAARENAGKGTDFYAQNRVTWQPAPDVRVAIVVQYFDGERPGYVVVGRNMHETEDRIWKMERGVIIGWIAILTLTLAVSWLGGKLAREDAATIW